VVRPPPPPERTRATAATGDVRTLAPVVLVALDGLVGAGADGPSWLVADGSLAGLRFVDPALAAEALDGGASPLSGREADVLRAAAGGGTVGDIARALRLSQGTVRNHLSPASGKTRARARAEAVRLEDRGRL
jgi:DNA-binding CsgD family transcriptional regulator